MSVLLHPLTQLIGRRGTKPKAAIVPTGNMKYYEMSNVMFSSLNAQLSLVAFSSPSPVYLYEVDSATVLTGCYRVPVCRPSFHSSGRVHLVFTGGISTRIQHVLISNAALFMAIPRGERTVDERCMLPVPSCVSAHSTPHVAARLVNE